LSRLAAVLVLVASAGLALADPPKMNFPPELRPGGQYAELLPDTDAVSVSYVGLSGVEPLPGRWLSDKRVFLLDTRGLKEGRYLFAAVGASKTGEQARTDFAVVVGRPGPAPVPPGPTPPDPTPPPDDPLLPGVRAAIGADQSPTKLADAAALAAVYRSLAERGVTAAAVKTAADLAAVIEAARRERVKDRLPAVREIFGGDFEQYVPAEPTAVLTADQKAAAAKALARYALVLEVATQ
jgi:hypothetical protein